MYKLEIVHCSTVHQSWGDNIYILHRWLKIVLYANIVNGKWEGNNFHLPDTVLAESQKQDSCLLHNPIRSLVCNTIHIFKHIMQILKVVIEMFSNKHHYDMLFVL